MVCLTSRRFVYIFKIRTHDSKTLECLNSSQKVQILLKKLGEIRKSSSYREKFIQGSDKFNRPTEMFEFLSVRVIEIFLPEKGQQVQGTDKFVPSNEMFELSGVNCIQTQKQQPELFLKKMFLKILQISQENTCKETRIQVFSCETSEIFKSTYFEEYLQMTACVDFPCFLS